MKLVTFHDKSSKYEHVYIPKFLRIHKTKLEHYEFIKTIPAGTSMGHILMGGGYYYMCLSKDDNISVEERTMDPMCFTRTTIEELERVAEVFSDAVEGANKTYVSKFLPRVVELPVFDTNLPWHIRMQGHQLINTLSGRTCDLHRHKQTIAEDTDLTIHLINSIIKGGIEVEHWTYYGKRVDGKSWEQHFEDVKTNMPHRTRDSYLHTSFTDGKRIVYFKTLRDTADALGTNHETLRQALINGDKEVNGFLIIRGAF